MPPWLSNRPQESHGDTLLQQHQPLELSLRPATHKEG